MTPQNFRCTTGMFGIGISAAEDHPADSRFENGFGAGRSSAVSAAWLQSYIKRRAAQILSVTRRNGIDFGMTGSGFDMVAGSQQNVAADNYCADHRVGVGGPPAFFRFAQSFFHPAAVISVRHVFLRRSDRFFC